jgi:hypothetical protein
MDLATPVYEAEFCSRYKDTDKEMYGLIARYPLQGL